MAAEPMKAHLAARAAMRRGEEEEQRPYTGRSLPQATLYPCNLGRRLEQWLVELQSGEEPPTAEQLQILEAIVQRVTQEAYEEQAGTQRKSDEDPLLDLIHGVPGAGKSRMIKWIRELFEQELGWTHGIQFVCLAFQNTMAAHIDGLTIHHWSGLPCGQEDGTCLTRDNKRLSKRCQCLRFIIIDEISRVSTTK